MKNILFVLLLLFVSSTVMSQHRPKCMVCKPAEFTPSTFTVLHTKADEIFLSTTVDTVDYVYKPAHQECSTDSFGRICTVDVVEEEQVSIVIMQKVVTVKYIPVSTTVAVLKKKYDAEIVDDCH